MSRCNRCGEIIVYDVMPNGKFRPINPDGSEHFDLCSKRQSDIAIDGAVYREYHEKNGKVVGQYEKPGCKPYVVLRGSAWITGKFYRKA